MMMVSVTIITHTITNRTVSFLFMRSLWERGWCYTEAHRIVVLLDAFAELGLLFLRASLVLFLLVVPVFGVLDEADGKRLIQFLVGGGQFGVQADQYAGELLRLGRRGGGLQLLGGGRDVLLQRPASGDHVGVHICKVLCGLVDGGKWPIAVLFSCDDESRSEEHTSELQSHSF